MQKLTDTDKANTAVCLNRLRAAHQRLLGHKNASVHTQVYLISQAILSYTYKAIYKDKIKLALNYLFLVDRFTKNLWFRL